MDFTPKQRKAIAKRKLVIANYLAKKAKKLREEAVDELMDLNVKTDYVRYNHDVYKITFNNEYVSRIFDTNLLNDLFGSEADKYKKDSITKASYSVKKLEGVE